MDEVQDKVQQTLDTIRTESALDRNNDHVVTIFAEPGTLVFAQAECINETKYKVDATGVLKLRFFQQTGKLYALRAEYGGIKRSLFPLPSIKVL